MRVIFAALLAATLGQAALAQVQLAQEVADQLAALGIDQTLIVTEEQLGEIENVLNSDVPDDTKRMEINEVLNK